MTIEIPLSILWVALAVTCFIWLRCRCEPRPAFVTEQGVAVYLTGCTGLTARQITHAIDVVIREFNKCGRWAGEDLYLNLRNATLRIVSGNSFVDPWGRRVGGFCDGKSVAIAWDSGPLAHTAFVHELVHYFDFCVTGEADNTHASWPSTTYPMINQVNAVLEAARIVRDER